MFDQDAAQRAAREVLAAAPRIEGGDGTELVISIRSLVDAIVAAGNPDALVIPPYDPETAPDARFRIEQPTSDNPGATVGIVVHPGAVALPVYSGDGKVLVSGFIGHEFAWHLGLALCSAAQESKSRSEVRS